MAYGFVSMIHIAALVLVIVELGLTAYRTLPSPILPSE